MATSVDRRATRFTIRARIHELENLIEKHIPSPRPSTVPPNRFPLEALPPTLRHYVQASAAATRVPPEAIAVPLLAFSGAIIGPRLRLEVSPGWYERPVLWIAIVALTGAGKSPAIRAARAPVDLLQQNLHEECRLKLHQWANNHQSNEPEPEPTHLLTPDPSFDAISNHLAQSNGIILLQDELYAAIRSMNRSNGADRQAFLSLWSSETITRRVDRNSTIGLESPVVSVVGGIQPLILRKMRSNVHDGLVERFLPVVLGVRHRYWHEANQGSLAPPVPRPFATLLGQLHSISGTGAPGETVRISAEAAQMWGIWFNNNVDLRRSAPIMLQGYFAKLPAHLARFALILHALWNPESPTTPISIATLWHAADLVEFFRLQMVTTSRLMGDDLRPRAVMPTLMQRIVRTLSEHAESEGWMTRTELLIAIGRPQQAKFDEAISGLNNAGTTEERTFTQKGSRKPRTEFRIRRD